MKPDWTQDTLHKVFGVTPDEMQELWNFFDNSPVEETVGDTVKRFLDLDKSIGLNYIFFLSMGEYIGQARFLENIKNKQDESDKLS